MGIRVAVAGASGYAGGELLRLIAGHPELELVAATAHSPGRAARRRRAPAAHRPRPRLRRDRPGAAGRRRPGLPGPAARAVGGARRPAPGRGQGRRPRRRPPAARRAGLGRTTTAAPHAGTWTYGLPELPGQRRLDRRRRPGRQHRLLRRGHHPRARAADRRRRRRTRRRRGGRRLRHLRGRPGAEGAPARQRGDGGPVALQGRRATSTCRRSSRRPGPPALSFTPVLAPMPRGILATVTARAAGDADPREVLAAAYADEPFVHVLPEGQLAAHRRDRRLQLLPPAGHAWTSTRAGSSCSSAIDNLGKGAAGQAVQCANLMLGLPETDRACPAVVGVAP